jgi:hypothetical protein
MLMLETERDKTPSSDTPHLVHARGVIIDLVYHCVLKALGLFGPDHPCSPCWPY